MRKRIIRVSQRALVQQAEAVTAVIAASIAAVASRIKQQRTQN